MQRATIIPLQPQLPQVLPTIEGNVDYRDFRDQLLHMNQMLSTSGMEAQLIESDLQRFKQLMESGEVVSAQGQTHMGSVDRSI